jgi:hypothetical protein
MLKDAETKGKGTLKWFPNTVAKDLVLSLDGKQITSLTGIKHQPQPGTPPLNTEPLSQVIEDIYRYEDSSRFKKQIVRFFPNPKNRDKPTNWYVIDATETGELIGLADLPHRLGIDPRSFLEPSSSTPTGDPYCTQGFTYTFAMEATAEPQPQTAPSFYNQYAPYYSYELARLADFGLVFTYRRIFSPVTGPRRTFGGIGYSASKPGDISMQNWTWGNDFRPGGSDENLILTSDQLRQTGQLSPGGWLGGLRTDTLRKGEEISWGYYYWLVAGDTDSQLGSGVKKPEPNHRFVTGLDSPMGTVHGLSKYPYIREGRRIIGRPSFGYPQGFTIEEVDMSRNNLNESEKIKENLSPEEFTRLQTILSGTSAIDILAGKTSPSEVKHRGRAKVFPDSVGIGHYAIDFHPCMEKSPPELPGNTERINSRDGQGEAYPFQIPLRSMIPQKIDNLLIGGKSIAVSHVAAAAYRVHSFEWSVGAAAANTAVFALEQGVLPYQLVENLPNRNPQLLALQKRLENQNNFTYFPGTSVLNSDWSKWR